MGFSGPQQKIRSSFCLYSVLLLPWSQSLCSSREKSHLSKAAKLSFSSYEASFEKLERAVTGAAQPQLSLMPVSTAGMQHISWAEPEANRLQRATCSLLPSYQSSKKASVLCQLSVLLVYQQTDRNSACPSSFFRRLRM